MRSENHTNRELMDQYWNEHPVPNTLIADQAVKMVKDAVAAMEKLNVRVVGEQISDTDLKLRIMDFGFG
jgi:hypothetical protein